MSNERLVPNVTVDIAIHHSTWDMKKREDDDYGNGRKTNNMYNHDRRSPEGGLTH